jgi:ATP-binding cassette subfamily C (CFTR/MRP) protein 4
MNRFCQQLVKYFLRCITEYLKTKTVVLVTHQIHFIKKATKILVLKEGRPLAFGSYDQLCESGVDFISLISEEKSVNEQKEETIREDILKIDRKRTISTLSLTKTEVFFIIINIFINFINFWILLF